jgi:hypothetical protein
VKNLNDLAAILRNRPPMKKTYPVSNNAKHVASYWKHLRKAEKRRVNKSTRKLGKIHDQD